MYRTQSVDVPAIAAHRGQRIISHADLMALDKVIPITLREREAAAVQAVAVAKTQKDC
jgi:hypothetical protein